MMRGVYGLPPGADFPRLLVEGLLARVQGDDPAALARVTLYLNTRRMQRAVERHLTAGGARFLPRMRLVSDLAQDMIFADLPAPVSGLRRRLELTQLVAALIAREPTIAAPTAVFDLAESLAALMDEMRGEGVLPAAVAAIDVSRHSAHWQRTQEFIGIIAGFFAADAAPDMEALQRMVTERLIARWQVAPPQDPVIVAGSTGSRGTTRLLMRAVADLPRGVLVLPGFDFDTPPAVWAAMADVRTGEDHPQFRYCRLMADLGLTTAMPWVDEGPPCAARNRLISLSLRPAPVTDQWLVEGGRMDDLAEAAAGMSLIVAPTLRAEAVAIALVLRRAVAEGRRAALMTPDRNLTRRVTAMLDQWGIRPDDSAGEPLTLAPTGRFLRMVAGLFGRRVTGEALLALLKHPAVARGDDRGAHLRFTQALERDIRAKGVAFPDAGYLRVWALGTAQAEMTAWGQWLAGLLDGLADMGVEPLPVHVAAHLALTQALARGPAGLDVGPLWTTADGMQTWAGVQQLQDAADAAGEVSPQQFGDILYAVLQRGEVRTQGQDFPDVMIWGTREARIQGADLVILGGLNDGVWPALPPPDAWLNRDMRLKAGLLLPERRIGLAGHDYQQAVCAPEVVLTRARRDAQAETVASRWLNRLTNLLEGLPEQGGRVALAGMMARGEGWLALAAALDTPVAVQASTRPAPRPPVADRPKQLSVTAIAKLNRDPYAVYAQFLLGLRPLQPLRPGPDPQLRGQIMHRILEIFVRNRDGATDLRGHLMAACDAVLAEEVAWPTTRALWRARMDRAADFFLTEDARYGGAPVLLERKEGLDLPTLGFRLTAKPDRIDVQHDGLLRLIDYKTGQLPTQEQQKRYDNQLLLEACMAERGAFGRDLPTDVGGATYIGLGSKPGVILLDTSPELLAQIWDGLLRVLTRYGAHSQGYAARRAMLKEDDESEYDHLSRYGEWTMTDRATPEDVGGGA